MQESAVRLSWQERNFQEILSEISSGCTGVEQALRVDRPPSALSFAAPSPLPATQGQRSKHVHQLTTGRFMVNTLPEPTLESKEICP